MKYSFDLSPEMSRAPITFVCKNCGVDSSEMVNQLIRQQLGLPSPTAAAPAVIAGSGPVLAPPPTTEPVVARVNTPTGSPAPRVVASVRAVSAPAVSVSATSARAPSRSAAALKVAGHKPPPAVEAAPPAEAPQLCLKHPGQLTTHRCLVCSKPICPKCMEVFGYVCSALCKGRAETQGIRVPAYAHQKAAVESKQWRRLGLIMAVSCIVLLSAGSFWIWYKYSGSLPKKAYSARFEDPAASGQSKFLSQDQLVFLHGGTLGRRDLKTKKEVWSQVLIDKKKIEEEAKRIFDQRTNAQAQVSFEWDGPRAPSLPELIESLQGVAARPLHLYVRGDNIWVTHADKAVRYDLQTGSPAKEIPFEGPSPRVIPHEDELLVLSANASRQKVTHIDLVSGNTRSEDVAGPASSTPPPPEPATRLTSPTPAAKPQNVPIQARLARPAVLAANANQQRAMAEMKDSTEKTAPNAPSAPANPQENLLLPSGTGLLQLTSKPLPAKPGASEARKRCQLTLRRFGAQGVPDWTEEAAGYPQLFPLKTVDVVVAGLSVWVFDRNNKKLWESKLSRDLIGSFRPLLSGEAPPWGYGPVVERGDTLYLFDLGELIAFDLVNGNVRWRLPSEYISGLHFDDQGMIYVNTSTEYRSILSSPDHTDVPEDTVLLVQKVDPKTGAVLWKVEREGLVRYVSGKFLYTVASQRGDAGEEELIDVPVLNTGFQKTPHVRVKRLDPGSGQIMWERYHSHAPLDVRFEKNTINFVCRKELQVLKFLSF